MICHCLAVIELQKGKEPFRLQIYYHSIDLYIIRNNSVTVRECSFKMAGGENPDLLAKYYGKPFGRSTAHKT